MSRWGSDFRSWYDNYRGVIVLVRVVDGALWGDKIYMKAWDKSFEILEVGAFMPHATALDKLESGDVGFVIANIKEVRDARVSDTIVAAKQKDELEPLSGFKSTPSFSGLFPVICRLRRFARALKKLKLMMRFLLNPRHRRPWDSAFDVAFWDCCIWRSFKNASNANSECRSLQLRQQSL